ncbi:putative 4-hydroxyphenylpyruvate dioxygenase [Aspergillus steynii IBT 23096]|uniref:Putative 4-hydroxyphenylpyruvate dioxygenase n=1 Tax=Aspergillus steynii IBT 23096 TaxID=1392250 RepID=A0A2I2FT03_9EURO|nr:putative 4-hydroxyphenylpyruvate dioxygenase [Aspergillus steynii IBT 23096]PLB43744.1 putative 4-hydroxyphenylpyruvate dioxygenase [Aspergillus steynii IBT 23096]
MPNRLGIASMSLGRPGIHPLPNKLHQAALHGYSGIELFFDDLSHLAETSHGGDLLAAAHHVHSLCTSLNLSIICLQPFAFYEGLLDRSQTEHLLTEKLPLWFQLSRILHTDLIQIPSNFLPADPQTGAPRTTGDREIIVSDLRRAADLGLAQSPPFRFVYEALAWGNHVDTWEAAYEIVVAVDRPNLGICLDTFNLAGRVYADPASASGKTANAELALQESLTRLRETVDVKKVFYLQIVDGERLAAPLTEGHEWHVASQPCRMSWSRNARLFAFEEERGGYLPVEEVARAFFDTGFEGWVSLELFSRTLADPDPRTPERHAKRGYESWRKMVKLLGLKEGGTDESDGESVSVSGASEGSEGSELVVQHRL